MSGFRAVNTTTLTVPNQIIGRPEETTPTTPRPNRFSFPSEQHSTDPHAEDPAAKTPTRDSFGGVSGQRPLPNAAFTPKSIVQQTPKRGSELTRGDSHRSIHSVDSQDIGMDDEDEDDDHGSDDESAVDGSGRPSKKKKGQRFFCKDYPPCNLSFTRSEHLARHIRKHTGERPFQCHCSRRFSRLDNLRQHAQTVHVNEDIPDGSLAATGTRFQRQIRTDRVRPPGGRSRASTLGSQSSHSRGHGRNLSTSSIASIASTTSTVSQRDDFRRPPVTLSMAEDGTARARLSLDTFVGISSPGGQFGPFSAQSPSGAATPASSIYSAGTGSPRFSSGMHSPVSTVPRPFIFGGSRTPGRRTSLPSAGNPFQPAQGTAPPGLPFVAPLTSNGPPASGQSSLFASPTSSVFSESRRESISSNADADWRRRTWHSGTQTNLSTQRPATSGLSYFQTPDAPQPILSNQPAASQAIRLPGIESFDHAPAPSSLVRRQPSPMQIDAPPRPTGFPTPPEYTPPQSRRNHVSWDISLNKGLNRLDIASATPPSESQLWAREGQGPPSRPSSSYFGQQPFALNSIPAEQPQQPHLHPQMQQLVRASNEPPATPKNRKRMGWYAGPPSAHQIEQASAPSQGNNTFRTSPDGSSSSEGIATPASSTIGDYRQEPAIMHSNGEVEQRGVAGASFDDGQKYLAAQTAPNTYHTYASPRPPTGFSLQPPPGRDVMAENRFQSRNPPNDMRRLEALVAVATSEEQKFSGRV